ncbi:ABC transporter ATP-binding protein [Erythrobacter sp. BLCC-B19]|uniref:ABC transporter ATP-binding protein n=1 Tax=Erythrobacter sp. BLCC-B19 TaxID=3025315 RepID=UPI0023606028|nr:ABC transporter ATP-binding protein [Erythrobacter sp. BLCC-B19]WDA40564.1 ABC transporter ATP-binding protein [Erythrobacter sp. BLCC-B19]
MHEPILSIRGLTKTYRNGPRALDHVDLDIHRGEIFALLGPNGAGKTTLIGAVCGLVRPSGGTITAFGHDLSRDWRRARARIGLVPQELATDMFETVWRAVAYSQGLFGRRRDPARIEEILRSLSLWDKRDAQIRALSGGMKRRVLIAKALAHDPELLFLDEPTAGVDVELRKDMWKQIAALKERGVTIILTTHYIEEAEEMADRVGIIQGGRIRMVDEKRAMMERLGTTEAVIDLAAPLAALPPAIAAYPVELGEGGMRLTYRGGNGAGGGRAQVAQLAQALTREGITFTSLDIHDSSLEDIFVGLLGQSQTAEAA